MTTTTVPNIQARFAKEQSLSPFVVRIDADRICSASAHGDWFVVVDGAGSLKRFARILRIRADL